MDSVGDDASSGIERGYTSARRDRWGRSSARRRSPEVGPILPLSDPRGRTSEFSPSDALWYGARRPRVGRPRGGAVRGPRNHLARRRDPRAGGRRSRRRPLLASSRTARASVGAVAGRRLVRRTPMWPSPTRVATTRRLSISLRRRWSLLRRGDTRTRPRFRRSPPLRWRGGRPAVSGSRLWFRMSVRCTPSRITRGNRRGSDSARGGDDRRRVWKTVDTPRSASTVASSPRVA